MGGEYDFVQLADPQLGMLHMDKSRAEELTMLKLAIDHVPAAPALPAHLGRPHQRVALQENAASSPPRGLPSRSPCAPSTPILICSPTSTSNLGSNQEALRGSTRRSLVLQPGNHDIGQNPSVGAATECRAGPYYGPTYYGPAYYGPTSYGSTY